MARDILAVAVHTSEPLAATVEADGHVCIWHLHPPEELERLAVNILAQHQSSMHIDAK